MNLKKQINYFTLLIISITLISCSGNKIKIGVIAPLTGGSKDVGISMKNGIILAAEEINKNGGILGKKITLIEKDDESNEEKGEKIVLEFINNDKVKAIFGSANTNVVDKISPINQKSKIPLIIPVSTGAMVNEYFTKDTANYIFRVAMNDLVQAEMMVFEAITLRKKSKPAIITDNTPYGLSGKTNLENELLKLSITPVYIGSFKINDTDMTEQLLEAQKNGADVLLIHGVGPELAALTNTLEKLNWNVEVIGNWALGMKSFLDNTKPIFSDNFVMPQTFIPSTAQREKELNFIKNYKEKFKVEKFSSAVSASQGYDALYLYKLAVEQANSFDGDLVRLALENLKTEYEGVTGRFNNPFSYNNHECFNIKKVKMGEVKQVR